MRLDTFKDSFTLFLGDLPLIHHSSKEPFIYAGHGNAKYEMERGAFVIDEKTDFKDALLLSNIEKFNNKFRISFKNENKNINIVLYFKEENNRLSIDFSCLSGDINRIWLNLKAYPNEHVYGCGETFTHFDLKGQNVRIWVAEHQNLKRLEKKFSSENNGSPLHFNEYETYYAQPTFVSSNKYFLHVNSDAYMEFDFRESEYHTLLIREVPKSIIIGKNDSFVEVISSLTDILGRQPELPDWIYNGVILGLQGGTETILAKVKNALDKGLQISALWCQDWQGRRITEFGKQLMWNWQWDKELYPHLDKEIKILKEKGIRFMGYINPFLAIEGELYAEASQKGYTVKNKDGNDYLVTITNFPAAMLDLSNPDAYTWIKEIIKKNMIEFGLSGWMADYGEYLPTDSVLHSGEDAQLAHNKWPAIWAKANREAIEEAGKLGEIVFFTRAGHTETVRYSTLMWAGDQHVDWSMDDGLPSVIPASLSLAMCGYGLCHSDIGGYTTLYSLKRTKELFMRWSEHSAFTPIMRSHEGNRPDSNVQFDFDDETLRLHARMSKVYKKLSPYIKALVKENYFDGVPVMRPLFMHYDEEKCFTESYQYLLGKDILVAPVLKEGVTEWTAYLPDDEWVHIWTGKEFNGGLHKVESPIGNPPVFYRKASRYAHIFRDLTNI
jgi:alpha-glucosidase